MKVGVRSYVNSLTMQNVFRPEALPAVIPELKKFGYKILHPEFKCVEEDCKTAIGRRINIPEVNAIGLIDLSTNQRITEKNIIDYLVSGIYEIRVRDTVSCVSHKGGFCSNCGNGFFAREGMEDLAGIGESYTLITSPRAYQNYIAKSFSGSLLGFGTLTSSPLPAPSFAWHTLTSHREMDKLCDRLKTLKVSTDEMEYLYTIEDILERALAIIGTYGVYGYA